MMCCYDEQALIIDIHGEREGSTHSEGLWWYHGNHESKAQVVCDDDRYVHCFYTSCSSVGWFIFDGNPFIKFIRKIATHAPESLLGTRVGQLSCTNMGRTNCYELQALPKWNEAEFPSLCYKGNSCAAREEPADGQARFPGAIAEIFILHAQGTGWFIRDYS